MAQSNNFTSLINTALPADVPPSFKDPEVRAAIEMLTAAINNTIRYVEQYCGITLKDPTYWSAFTPDDTLLMSNLRRLYVKASENLTYGQMVNLFNNAGVLNARRAQATAGTVRKAHGYVNLPNGFLAGAYGEVIVGAGVIPIAGVTIGTDYYLSAAVLGAITNVAPGGAGQLEQFIGFGVGVDLLCVNLTMGSFIQH